MHKRLRYGSVVGLVAVLMATAACGDDGDDGGAVGAGAESAGEEQAAGDPADVGRQAPPEVDMCSLLDPAEIEPVVGRGEVRVGRDTSRACEWIVGATEDEPLGEGHIGIYLASDEDMSAAMAYNASREFCEQGGEVTDVAGLGDAAFKSAWDACQLTVKSDPHTLDFYAFTTDAGSIVTEWADERLDWLEPLAHLAVERL